LEELLNIGYTNNISAIPLLGLLKDRYLLSTVKPNKLGGPIIVKIAQSDSNKLVTKNGYLYLLHNRNSSHLVGTSETTRTSRFNEWLSGLIDGDGTLQISKKGYPSCEITVHLSDEKMLRIIQNELGGSIKPRSGVQAVRWRLHNKEGIIDLIHRINGNIRHSSRLKQLHHLCSK
jgi:hypothetical protein